MTAGAVQATLPLASASWPLFVQLTVSGLILGSSYALLSVSFGIIYSTTRIFHFAHSVVYAAGAYLAVVASENLGLPLAGAVVVGLLAALALGVAVEVFAYRSMRGANATLLAIFLTSLGLSIVGPNLIQIVFGPDNKTLPGFDVHTYSAGSVTFTNRDVLTVVVAWALIAALLVFLRRSRHGVAITAVRTNRDMAAAVGISPDRVYVLVFAIGSLLVGVAAVLFMLNGAATPSMGVAPALTGFIAAFLGGIGSMAGAALGGMLLGLLSSLSGLWLSSDYRPAVVFGIMFVLLIFRPQGILGRAAA